jgi:hypothetical protein
MDERLRKMFFPSAEEIQRKNEQLERELDEHIGESVAIHDWHVIASDPDPHTLEQIVRGYPSFMTDGCIMMHLPGEPQG